MRVPPLSALLLGLSVLLFAACKADGEQQAQESPTSPPAASPAIQRQPQVVQPLDSEAAEPEDSLLEVRAAETRFQPNHLRITIGTSVTLRVLNGDGQPHNLRIAGPDGEYETEDDAVTQPPAIAPGGSGELIFAPALAGNFTFRCDFHPGSMGGRIVVTAAQE